VSLCNYLLLRTVVFLGTEPVRCCVRRHCARQLCVQWSTHWPADARSSRSVEARAAVDG